MFVNLFDKIHVHKVFLTDVYNFQYHMIYHFLKQPFSKFYRALDKSMVKLSSEININKKSQGA